MKRSMIALVALVIFGGMSAPRACAWGLGTHAYIVGKAIGKGGGRNLKQVYAACLPDMLNFATDLNPFVPGGIYDTLHGATAGSDLVGDWNAVAESGRDRATAYGYLSHAAPGCADEGAHGVPYGTGYAPAMAAVLYSIPEYQAAFAGLGIDQPTALFFCEVIVEDAIDLMLAETDRGLGRRMVAAGSTRKKTVPGLVVGVFADDFAAYGGAPFLVQAEAQYRLFVMAYGRILDGPPEAAQASVSELLAMSALDMLGFPFPPGTPEYAAALGQFATLASSMLSTSKLICADAPVVLESVIESTAESLELAGFGSRRRGGH